MMKNGKIHCNTDNIQFLGLFFVFILLTCIAFILLVHFQYRVAYRLLLVSKWATYMTECAFAYVAFF